MASTTPGGERPPSPLASTAATVTASPGSDVVTALQRRVEELNADLAKRDAALK